VALPRRHEEMEPSFAHHATPELPVEEGEGAWARVVAGSVFGRRSPVATLSDLVFVDVALQPGACLEVPGLHAEQAIYVTEGELDLGRDGRYPAGQLLVLKPGATVTLRGGAATPTRLVVLGGEPMDGPRYLAWNFVASSAERIEQAKQDWRDGRFPAVPGETEFIPLPELPGKPARTP
jgi:redox-sensitive bicupin YhaK (pirin superfamily)